MSNLSSQIFKYLALGVFLGTGVFSTCIAQYVFYQGAGDQRAMILPLCNYLGMMLVGLFPIQKKSNDIIMKTKQIKSENLDENNQNPEITSLASSTPSTVSSESMFDTEVLPIPEWSVEDANSNLSIHSKDAMELSHRQLTDIPSSPNTMKEPIAVDAIDNKTGNSTTPVTTVSFSLSVVQLCVAASVLLDFAGCLFCNMGLSMAGSGLYQVLYSSVICWAAIMSRYFLRKSVSRDEWIGIALVTFGLAYSALGSSSGGKSEYLVLMGCLSSLIGAGFYGGTYVLGEYTLKLPERPEPQTLCLNIGTACMAIVAVYQTFVALPRWHEFVTIPIHEANGNTLHILLCLLGYTISQLLHGVSYFTVLEKCGAVTTGIMQSLRAVCVFIISSMLYCNHQQSQCFDTKRGIATLIVVIGVTLYSWAKSQSKRIDHYVSQKKTKYIAGKSYIV